MCNKRTFYKSCTVTSGCCTLVFLLFGIYGAGVLHSLIKQQAAEGAAMTPSTFDMWGLVPGSTGAFVIRNYSFYNWTNPREVIYFGKKPVFYQLPGSTYQEYQEFVDPHYKDLDKDNLPDLVEFGFWQYVQPLEPHPDQIVITVNLGALGFWYNAKNAPDYQIAVNVIASLILGLEEQIIISGIGTGLYYQLFPNYTNLEAAWKQYLSPDILAAIWNDNIMGVGNPGSIVIWAQAGVDGPQSGAAYILKDYFHIPDQNMSQLLDKGGILVKTINEIVKAMNFNSDYDCPNFNCTGPYLSALQWSTQIVTSRTPNGIPSYPSIVSTNDSVTGYPEISYFLSDYLIPNYGLDPGKYNITFDMQLAQQLLNHTPSPGSKYCTNPDTLLHIGNLQFMFDIGRKFDALNQTEDLTPLKPIQDRFKLPSLIHAHVLWRYMDYLVSEFGIKKSLGGNIPILVMGSSISQVLWAYFDQANSYLLRELEARIMYQNFTSTGKDCAEYFADSFERPLYDVEVLCTLDYLTPFDKNAFKFLIEACRKPFGDNWARIVNDTGLTNMDMLTFCQDVGTKDTFATTFDYTVSYIHDYYNCSKLSNECSNYEIAIMQWGSSAVTSNPPPILNLDPTLSLSDWNSTLFPQPFEYPAVLNEIGLKVEYLDYNTSLYLMTYDCLLNGVIVSDAFIYAKNPNLAQNYTEQFFGLDPKNLNSYLRYVMIELFFGGFHQTRTAQELLWGYEDPVLKTISETDPLLGGDPSVDPIIDLSGGNMSRADAIATPTSMYTGANNSDLTRFYYQVYGTNIIVMNQSTFNGNEVVQYFASPWAEDIPIQGTDSFINKPGLTTDYEIPIFINSLYYQQNLTFQGEKPTYNGITAYRYRMSQKAMQNKTNNPDNAKWFIDRWNGLLNYSTIQQVPVFFSKAHLLDADPYILEAVDVFWDSELTQKIVPTSADDTFVDVEPYSGANIGSMIRLQLNYELAQDDLFPNVTYAMLPLFILERGSNFTDAQVSFLQIYCNF